MTDNRLEELLKKQAIVEVVYRYARAIDRLDEAPLRSCFHPGSIHNHFFEGPSSDPSLPSTAEDPADFVGFALERLRTYSRTHHQMGNIMIDFTSADQATVETYFTAFHRVRPIGDPLAGAQACDTEMDYFVGGRYIDKFQYIDGVWGIVSRIGMTDWARLEAPCSQGFGSIAPETIGKRAPDDLICEHY
ncbi:nuclear transport factor 2 family protein [Halieaceae bacterium IMCC14734]|uniref:Nuclear transport factor 2 family protein n=1 Tax=Candidatus Litorirhabdus singularis TaxID=2518993 RepID=A0ABT3TKL9_9GAMM|nr:nuclear transport factor 2 family protein [Candidatus Litorirhabdus singularis]MCX2982833.1 nuclear transport factor 2 family protein [Candidatus Litorirhabdus singularis]